MNMKSKGIAYMLWLVLGVFGGHKFYLGQTGMGLLYLCTGGGFFILWFIDFFKLGNDIDNYNKRFNNGMIQVNVNNY